MTPTLMTKSEYARHRGVSPQAVDKLIKNERIMVTPDGKVDVEISDIIMNQFSDSEQSRDMTYSNLDDEGSDFREGLITQLATIGSYSEQRALLTSYKAQLAKIELDKAAGKSLDAERVRCEAFTTGRSVRDSVLNLSDKLAPIVATMDNIHAIRTLLDTEFRKALTCLYNEFIPAEGIV